MPQDRIPFVPDQQSGLDPLSGASPLAVNAVILPGGVIRRRPGIAAFSDGVVDADGIVCVYATVTGRIYAIGDTDNARSIYRLNSGVPVLVSLTATGFVRGSSRPIVAETEAMLAIAGGSDIQRVYFAGDDSDRLSSDAPLASHVIANNSRLLANSLTTELATVAYSSIGTGTATSPHEEWTVSAATTAGAITAEARPDHVVALAENTNEVYAFGSTSVQVYGPDPTFDYGAVSTREYGCIAPYSVVKVDGYFFWLDHLRRVVRSDGRSFEVLSTGIKGSLDAMEDVTDCFAYRVTLGAIDAVVFCFPTDGRSFAYQLNGGWSLWMGWNAQTNNYKRLTIESACVNPATGQILVGTSAGKVGELRAATYDDLGEAIVMSITTGYQSRGTDGRKHCKVVRLAFRRGETLLSGQPTASLYWRDDGGAWSAPMLIGLGASGDYDPVIELRSLGVYRRREWKLEFSGAEEFVLVSATEEFELLDG